MLHLHRGLALEDEGGSRTRVRMAAGPRALSHVSCLAEQAKIWVAEAEENNLGNDALYGGVPAVGHVQIVRAGLPRRRIVCARVGVLAEA